MIKLEEKHFIAEGRHRYVYVDPRNDQRCIKVPKSNLSLRAIKREIRYLEKYGSRCAHFMSLYHEDVQTTMGRGYVFDLIRNMNGNVSQSLVKSRSLDGIGEKVVALYKECLEHQVIMGDLSGVNVVVRRRGPKYSLFLVDGVGNSDFVKVCDYSRRLGKKKMTRKFRELAAQLKMEIDFEA